jgi:hypothetical protein
MSAFYDQASLVVVPSGYKSGKIYAQKPLTTDGQLTFTRASTATRVNASGLIETVASGVPRLDYTNSSCPKLQLEPQRTNDLTRSQEFDNVVWSKIESTITANTTETLDPFGTNLADKLVESSANDQHVVFQGIAGNIATFSFFAKAAGRNWIAVLSNNGSHSFFNIANGTLGIIQSGSTATITAYGNGWYRCTLYNSHPSFGATIYLASANGTHVYQGNGTSGAYIFGAQIEASATYATSYIPTTSAAVTRLADDVVKTSATSIIGQTEGVAFVDFEFTGNYSSGGIVPICLDGGNTFEMYFWVQPNGVFIYEVFNSTNQVSISGSIGAVGRKKVAIAYKQNDFALYLNGVQIGTDTSGTIPACNRLYVGRFYGNTTYNMTSGVNQAILFKTRLTNAQLAELTTL